MTATRLTPTMLEGTVESLTPLHTAGNRELQAQLQQLPNWTAARDQLIQLSAAPDDSTSWQGSIVDNLADAIMKALEAGEVDGGELLEFGARVKNEIEIKMHLRQAMTQVRTTLTSRLDNALRGGCDQVLAGLNERLQNVVDEARSLGRQARRLTAEQAIDAGKVAEFQAYEEIAHAYAAIRSAQRLVASKLVEGRYAEAQLMSNLLEVFPHWSAWRGPGYVEDPDTRQRRDVSAPWPTQGGGLNIDGDAHASGRTPEFLDWAIEAGARLWVPTRAQLEDYEAELHQAQRSERDDDDRPRRRRGGPIRTGER